jgi:hypothetical protein
MGFIKKLPVYLLLTFFFTVWMGGLHYWIARFFGTFDVMPFVVQLCYIVFMVLSIVMYVICLIMLADEPEYPTTYDQWLAKQKKNGA